MNSVTLTFAANGQQLVRTGCEKFAANTVNYIQAKFDLGEGWDGFDSVRAVWQTDFAKIATVLDNDGNCTVPQEVLKRVNSIMVNLVGSISDGTELTDRLTTYKIKALDVNGATNIDGTETAEITPSQFEQFVAIVRDEVAEVKDIDRVELNPDYTLTIYFSDGTSTTTGSIRGEAGPEGPAGETGNGIESIDLTGSSGNIDTYTISFTDGSTTTFTVTNGEVTMEQLSQVLPTDTASGDIASFPDGTDLIPLQSLTVTLDPIQDLNGYDAPWVGGAGKNLWQPFSGTARGITFTLQDDGTVAVSGTVTQSGWPQIQKDYTITELGWSVGDSFYVYVGNTEQANSAVRFLDSGGTQISQISNNASGTVPEGTATVRFVQIGARGTAPVVGDVINTVGHFYVCRGTTAPTAWTPYENICPISGHTEVVTQRTGKNLWGGVVMANGIKTDIPQAVLDTGAKTISYLSGYATPTSNFTSGVRFKENTQYTIILKFSNTVARTNMRIVYTDGTSSIVATSATGLQTITFVSSANKTINFIGGSNNDGTSVFYYEECGVFEGVLTADDFEPYEGDTYTAQLPETVYGGTVDLVSGELVVDKIVITKNTADMDNNESYPGWKDAAFNEYFGNGRNVVVNEPLNIGESYWVNTVSERGALWLPIGTYGKTQSEWIVLAQDIQITIPLATPQTYQLTPQQINTLLGQNNVWSEQGSVAVVYKADIQLWVEKKLA